MATDVIAVTDGSNPYVGPRPFHAGERLHGRTRELNELRHSLIADRVLLLCAPSGAGKSSLLEAGLRPALVAEGFVVPPTIRVSHELESVTPANRYTASVLLSLEQGAGRSSMSPEAIASMTLAEYSLEPLLSADGELCLFFDQFEEVFTLDPIDVDAKTAFFRQLGIFLQNPGLWVVFAMREDYIAQLEPYLDAFPHRLATRMRLDFLDVRAAAEAVVAPARAHGITFDDDAVRRLVDDLRTMKVMRNGREDELPGPYVEPVQLQVVCRQMFGRLPAGTTVVSEADVELYANPTNALAEFYAEQVAAAAARAGVPERFVRSWFERQLITPQGFRAQTNTFPAANGTEVLDQLENSYLIRSESGRGQKWYELTHDRMIAPVVDNNRTWFAGRLNRVQRLAAEWVENNEPDGMLVTGAVLHEAQSWMSAADDVSDAERRFVEASGAREEGSRRQLRQARRRSIVFGALALLALGGLLATVLLWVRSGEKDREAESAKQANAALALAARSKASGDPYESALLAIEADAIGRSSGGQHPDAWQVSAAKFATETLWRSRPSVALYAGLVSDVDWSPDGATLAVVCSDGRVVIIDPSDGTVLTTGEFGDVSPLQAAWSPSGRELAVLADDGVIRRMRATDGFVDAEPLAVPGTRIVALAWSPDGRALAAATDAGAVHLLEASTGRSLSQIAPDDESKPLDVRFRPDGSEIAVLTDAAGLYLVPVRRQRELLEPRRVVPGESVTAVAWVDQGARLLIGLEQGTALALDPSGQQVGQSPGPSDDAITVLLGDPSSDAAIGLTSSGRVRLIQGGSSRELSLDGPTASVVSVSWSTAGVVALGTDDGSVRLVDAATGRSRRAAIYLASGMPFGATFQPVTTNVLAFGMGSLARLYDADSGEPLLTIPGSGSTDLSLVAWSADGRRLALHDYPPEDDGAGRIRIIDLAGPRDITDTYLDRPATTRAVAWGRDGELLVVADDRIEVRDGAGGSRRLAIDATGVDHAAWSPDGRLFALAVDSGTLDVYRLETGAHVGHVQGDVGIAQLTWNSSSTMLGVRRADGSVAVWTELGPAVVAARTSEAAYGASSLAWSPDGETIVLGYPDGVLRSMVLDGTTGGPPTFHVVGDEAVDQGEIDALTFTTDGHAVRIVTSEGVVETFHARAAGGRDTSLVSSEANPLLAWNGPRQTTAVADGRLVHLIASAGASTTFGVGADVSSMSWNEAGDDLAIVSTDGVLDRYNPVTGTRASPVVLSRLFADGVSMAFSAWTPAGDLLVLGSSDGVIHLVDRAGAPRPDAAAAAGFFASPHAWSPDGSRLLVATDNGMAAWDPGDGAVSNVGPGSYGAWNPDGDEVALSDGAQTITLVRIGERKGSGRDRSRRLHLTSDVVAMAWSGSGDMLAVLTVDGRLRFVDRLRWETVGEPLLLPLERAGDLAWVGDDQLVVAGAGGRVVTLRSWSADEACTYLRRVSHRGDLDATKGTALQHACDEGSASGTSLPVFVEIPTA